MRIGLIGSGSWGTALAKILTDNGHDLLWCVRSEKIAEHIRLRHHNPKYLSSVYFGQDHLEVTTDMAMTYAHADAIILAVPSAYVEACVLPYEKQISRGVALVSAVKGMLPESNMLLDQFLASKMQYDGFRYVSIMGPCHAEEVASEKLSYLTFAGKDEVLTKKIAAFFNTSYINTVTTHDVAGVQYAAVLKNIYALGSGIAHGLGYGDNFLSVFIANAAGESKRFLEALSGSDQNCDLKTADVDYSTSVYLGDLLVTCYSLFSRNRAFGNLIGKGYSIASARQDMQMVAEGYPASRSIHQLNSSMGVEMPILETIHGILWEHVDAASGFENLEARLR